MKKIFLSISLILLTVSCGKKTDADKIAEAQACLDTATATTAAACADSVEGMTTSGAYLIRCVAGILEANFLSVSNIQSIVDSTKNGSSAGSTTAAFDFLTFPMTAGATLETDYTKAKTAKSNCTLSESPGMQWIMNLAFTATSAKYCVLLGNGTDIATAFANASCQTAVAEPIGAALNEAYATNCGTGQGQDNSAVCSQMDAARAACGETNTNGIGIYLMQVYGGDTTPSCS